MANRFSTPTKDGLGEPGNNTSKPHHDERTPLLLSDRGETRHPEALPNVAPNLFDALDDSQSTKSVWYMILLTISLGGLQMAWSVELSNGTPYLLSLGISKSLMALVWIAGPLSGTLVQPYIGLLSDNCRSSMGRRKPFMLGGAAATIASLLFLAWAKEMVAVAVGIFGVRPESDNVKTATMVVAVVGIYVLDIAINTVQAAIRAFIVDCAPAHQQEAANAMASRVLGGGNILGYLAGYVNLTGIFWFLGHSQFQILCAAASLILAVTIGITTIAIPERDPNLDGSSPREQPNLFAFFSTVLQSIRRLPLQVTRVCQVEFFAWIGFFPLLFYTTSYIGGLYADPILRDHPGMSEEELDRLYEEGTRIGTFALLVHSIVSLGTNLFVPFFVLPTYDNRPVKASSSRDGEIGFADRETEGKLAAALEYVQIPGFTLRRAWFGSLILFSLAAICASAVSSVQAATVWIGLAGVTWAMTLWAPWAIIGAEVSRRDTAIRASKLAAAAGAAAATRYEASLLGPVEAVINGGEALIGDVDDEVEEPEEEVDQAGVILGIHNMAIAAPQFIATFASSIIFAFFQRPRDTPGDNSLSIVFALGGMCVLVASAFVTRINDRTSTKEEYDGERGHLVATDGISQSTFLQSRKSSSSR